MSQGERVRRLYNRGSVFFERFVLLFSVIVLISVCIPSDSAGDESVTNPDNDQFFKWIAVASLGITGLSMVINKSQASQKVLDSLKENSTKLAVHQNHINDHCQRIVTLERTDSKTGEALKYLVKTVDEIKDRLK